MCRTLTVGALAAFCAVSYAPLGGQERGSTSSLLVVADSGHLLLPTVVNGLRRLTDSVAAPLFDEVIDANIMQSAARVVTPLRRLLWNLSNPRARVELDAFPEEVIGIVTEAAEMLFVRVTPLAKEVYEFQLTHFCVATPTVPEGDASRRARRCGPPDSVAAARADTVLAADRADTVLAADRVGPADTIRLADLTRPMRSVSVIIDVQSEDYERRLMRALAELFPESNVSPAARIHVDGQPLDAIHPHYAFAGDTVLLDGSASLDSDTPPEELSFLWTASIGNLRLDRRSPTQSIVLPADSFRLTLRVSDGFQDSHGEAVGRVVPVTRPDSRLNRRSMRLNATRTLLGAWERRDPAGEGFFEETVGIQIDDFDSKADVVCVQVGERGARTCVGESRDTTPVGELTDRQGLTVGGLGLDEPESGWPYRIRIATGHVGTDTLHVTVTRHGLTVLEDAVVVEVYREPTMLFRAGIGAAYSTIHTEEAPEGGDSGVSVGASFIIRPLESGYLELGQTLTPNLQGYELGIAMGVGGWFGSGRLRSRLGAKLVFVPVLTGVVGDAIDSASEPFKYIGMTGGAMWALEPVERLLLVAEAGVLAGGPGGPGIVIKGVVFEANIGLALAF